MFGNLLILIASFFVKHEPVVATHEPIIVIGTASYYNHGKICADGSAFNTNAATCAFYINPKKKRQYLGRYVLVTNNKTHKTVRLRVTDNGGFVELGRAIDLTEYGFKALGGNLNQGLMNVTIKIERK